ncbi:MAG: hypothetical protein IJT27_05030 [Clostridia bacterium]|nr:hypothetical protein [Clostridia bacterium]
MWTAICRTRLPAASVFHVKGEPWEKRCSDAADRVRLLYGRCMDDMRRQLPQSKKGLPAVIGSLFVVAAPYEVVVLIVKTFKRKRVSLL